MFTIIKCIYVYIDFTGAFLSGSSVLLLLHYFSLVSLTLYQSHYPLFTFPIHSGLVFAYREFVFQFSCLLITVQGATS